MIKIDIPIGTNYEILIVQIENIREILQSERNFQLNSFQVRRYGGVLSFYFHYLSLKIFHAF